MRDVGLLAFAILLSVMVLAFHFIDTWKEVRMTEAAYRWGGNKSEGG